MKIAYGITKSNFGGAQRYVFELASEMSRQGHQVVVMCGQKGKLVEKLEEEKLKVITFNNLNRDISIVKEIKSFIEILKALREERPNVFHINSSKMGGIGALAGRIAGVNKIIFTSHGWAFNESRPLFQKIIIKIAAWITVLLSHKTICVSERTREQISNWPFIKTKLVVVHNGIKSFDLLEKTNTTFTIGTTGELHKIKGHDILLSAWQKFIKGREAKLVIIGDGEERESLLNMAQNKGISDSVEFKGFIDNARAHMANFDIFVFPSRSENLPYSILEAGIANLPVIASAVGGIPEIIESGVNGILVPKEDSEAIFSNLVLLSENPELRKRLGTSLKQSVIENFSFEKMFGQTLKTYL